MASHNFAPPTAADKDLAERFTAMHDALQAGEFGKATELAYDYTGKTVLRVIVFSNLAHLLPGEGGIIHAQEAVRLVDEMHAEGCSQALIDNIRNSANHVLAALKRIAKHEKRVEAAIAAKLKEEKESEVKNATVKDEMAALGAEVG